MQMTASVMSQDLNSILELSATPFIEGADEHSHIIGSTELMVIRFSLYAFLDDWHIVTHKWKGGKVELIVMEDQIST